MADKEIFGEDPEQLAALAESLALHVADLGEDVSKDVLKAVDNLPSRFYITRKMSKTEIGWLRDTIRQLWKSLTGKDISDYATIPSPRHAVEYEGNFWLLPGGIAVHAYNHFTAAKKHKGVICSLLDINGFVFERKLSEPPMRLIAYLLEKGAARVNIDRDKSQVIAQCSENSWPWVREKLRRMVHKKKVARVLDPTKTYEGWKSGIPIRIK
jgi:hypothetical protein